MRGWQAWPALAAMGCWAVIVCGTGVPGARPTIAATLHEAREAPTESDGRAVRDEITEEEGGMVRSTAPFDELWDFDDPAGTERRFRELRPSLEAAGDRSLVLELDTQIARTLGLQRRFGEAHELLNTVEEELDAVDPVVRVRWLLERGRAFHSAGKKEPARRAFLDAWELGRSSRADVFAVDAAHMMAIVEEGDEAIRWNEVALDYARSSEDPKAKGWKGSLLNNLGWTYHDAGEHTKALELFEEALEFRRAEGKDRAIDVAEWCVARELRALGRVEEALSRQRDLLRRKEEAERGSDGYVFEEIGECLRELGQDREARPWFRKAYAELSKDPWLVENEAERLERLQERGR